MPNLLYCHRQTTMTQQFGYAEAEEEKGSHDESPPPNWGHVQDPSTVQINFVRAGPWRWFTRKKPFPEARCL